MAEPFDDLIARARSEASPEAAAPLLAAARAAVSCLREAHVVLRFASELSGTPDADLRADVQRVLELAVAEGGASDFDRAASILATSSRRCAPTRSPVARRRARSVCARSSAARVPTGSLSRLASFSRNTEPERIPRAFACATLLLSPGEEVQAEIHGPILLESILALGEPSLLSACVELFVHLVTTCPFASQEGGTRLLVLLAQAAVDPEDARLAPLAEQIASLGIDCPTAGRSSLSSTS